MILRLYEAHGARGTAYLRVGLPFEEAMKCNTLEDEDTPLVVTDSSIRIPYAPHQLISIVLR